MTRALIVIGMLLAAPASAFADFFVVPFAGMKFGGSTSIVDLELAAGKKKLVLGVAARKFDNGIVGYEAEFGNVTGFFSTGAPPSVVKGGNYVNDLTGSVILSLPPEFTGGGLRPYATIGGGLIHAASQDFAEVFTVRRTVPAFNLGIGATGMLTNNVGVRFDVRYLKSITSDPPSGSVGHSISYSRFTIGLMLRP